EYRSGGRGARGVARPGGGDLRGAGRAGMTLGTLTNAAETGVRREASRKPFEQLLWLTGAKLYLGRRPGRSKGLLAILLGPFALVVGFVLLAYASIQSTPTQTNCPPRAEGGCFTPEIKARAIEGIRAPLTFPTSLGFAGGFTTFVGVIVLVVLAGTLVGSEY